MWHLHVLLQCLACTASMCQGIVASFKSQNHHRTSRQSSLRSNSDLRRSRNMHSESWQAHPHQANRDWHAPRAHQSVRHQRASSVDQKCQTYAQGITVEVILCKYSRHQDIHARCGCCFTSRWVLSFCGQKRVGLRGGAWDCRVSQNIHLTTEAFKE